MQTRNIDIKGLDKAEILAALYNNSKILGMGFFGQRELGDKAGQAMTKDEARKTINSLTNNELPLDFDFLNGKVMKVDLSGDEFSPLGYDRANGAGAAMAVISHIRQPSLKGEQAIKEKLAKVREDLKQDPKEVVARANESFVVSDAHAFFDAHVAMPAEKSSTDNNFAGFKKGFLNKK